MKKERILLMSALIAASALTTQARINYPDTRRVNTVDNYFGTQVPDPYRWLEDDRSAEIFNHVIFPVHIFISHIN